MEAEREEIEEKFEDMLDKDVVGLTVMNLPQDTEYIQKDSSRIARNDDWLKNLQKDIYSEEALHVIRDRCRDMQHRPCHRMFNRQRPRVQVQLVAALTTERCPPAIAKVFLSRAAVFPVPDNRMSDLCHMGAQLMGATCNRLHRDPSRARRDTI